MGTTYAPAIIADGHQPCLSHLSVQDAASVMLIVSSAPQERQALAEMLGMHACPRYWTSAVREAKEWLTNHSSHVVVCDESLPDGKWHELWEHVQRLPNPPLFIVSAYSTDARLWAEVLNVGAYDVIVKPYEKHEVSRILQHACRDEAFRVRQGPQ